MTAADLADTPDAATGGSVRSLSTSDGAFAALLSLSALLVALPFRAEAVARSSLVWLGWDAALHATEGLDLYDALRLGHFFEAVEGLATRHWWGPTWALASAPFQALMGPSLAAASLPSLLAFVLAPAAAFLLVRQLTPGGLVVSLAAGAFVGTLFLRSPMFLETSAWPMLESLGGFLTLVAWVGFARRGEARGRKLAFLTGAALFFLKYHFGFFVLSTFAAVVVVECDAANRARLAGLARDFLLRGAGASFLGFAAVLVLLRAAGVSWPLLPSVPNIVWGVLAFFAILGFVRRRVLAAAWRDFPASLRDFSCYGLLPPALWCLDPANTRAWYHQIFQPTIAPERNPLARLRAFAGFLRDDYTLGALPFGIVLVGLCLALVLPGGTTRRALAGFAVWPVALMSFNTYPVEARFLGCLAPSLFAAAVAGLCAAALRIPGRAAASALSLFSLLALASLLAVFVPASAGARWESELRSRVEFRYAYGSGEAEAINTAVASVATDATVRPGRVDLTLPADPPVWPGVRLALRLARRDLAPRDVRVTPR